MEVMPRSRVNSVLGLTGVVVERVQHQRDIHVWGRPGLRPLKHTRQDNRLMIVHLIVPEYHCITCNRYFCQGFMVLTLMDFVFCETESGTSFQTLRLRDVFHQSMVDNSHTHATT